MGAAGLAGCLDKQVSGLEHFHAEPPTTARPRESLCRIGCSKCKHEDMLMKQVHWQENANVDLRLHALVRHLFRIQDLKSDGVLDETELIRLNEKIAVLHYGEKFDRSALKAKYSLIFREKLDADGRPIPFVKFCQYMLQVLREIDSDPYAQEMILEHFIEEANSARRLLCCFAPDVVDVDPFMDRPCFETHNVVERMNKYVPVASM